MNKITILAIGTVFVVSMIAITAFEAEAKPPAQAICLAENIQHWNKIIFEIDLGSPDRNVVHPTLPDLETSSRHHEIIIQVPTDRALTIQELVTDRLNELGYLRETSTPGQLFPIDPSNIKYVDVEYSTICAEN